ncbi:hypothetical protein JOF29_000915 [Kribbella aluminosa]|uniref:PASTA domain-containing protein n=1 Tax=Kribbella aluminosa TaxID=416017 RepID=A0ABS4UDV8_9ACTN|nr:PASTA domain-containing protein [Kribbella aluminosa]MBP2349832.1 hypothetical protein [Kribbella aluminosa]
MTNKAACGTPQQDTVLIDDPSATHFCSARRPDGVDSVQLSGRRSLDFHADEAFEIDGVRAERQHTTCSTSSHSPTSDSVLCSGAVGIPSLTVWFRADSSTSAQEVDRMLSRIQIVQGRPGVPSYSSLGGAPTGPLVAGYTPVLKAAGLKAHSKPVKSLSYPAGTILGVSPAVGTMLPVGAIVTVTVAK